MAPRPSSFSGGSSPPLSGHKQSSPSLYNRQSDTPSFSKLFVGSLPHNFSEEEVREVFSDFGNVVEVNFLKDRKTGMSQGCCFIKYTSVLDAERAIRSLDNQRTLKGASEPLHVKFADGDRDHSGPHEHKLFVGSVSRQANEQDIEEESIQDQISEVPFEELQKARSNGSFSFCPLHSPKLVPKRANKNRPVEMSSKKPVSRFREVMQAPKHVVRDPRFESLCGSYEEPKFKNSYSFLYDEELPAEKKRLQELLRGEKSGATISELQKHIKWIDTQLKEEQERRKRDLKLHEQKGLEKEAVKQGKKPFYTKKAETRKQQLIAKYEELKANGKLEAFLAKRRRKNAAKDHRYIPYRRQHAAQAED